MCSERERSAAVLQQQRRTGERPPQVFAAAAPLVVVKMASKGKGGNVAVDVSLHPPLAVFFTIDTRRHTVTQAHAHTMSPRPRVFCAYTGVAVARLEVRCAQRARCSLRVLFFFCCAFGSRGPRAVDCTDPEPHPAQLQLMSVP